MHIAVVDAAPNALERIQKALDRDITPYSSALPSFTPPSDWKVAAFDSARQFKRELRKQHFDLILLDWELPDAYGIQIMGWTKNFLNPSPPIIIFINGSSEEDAIEVLASGADDFISKPLIQKELLARAFHILARQSSIFLSRSEVSQDTIKIKDIVIDSRDESISYKGEKIDLTHKEYRLATLLLQQVNRPIARSYLYESVWGKEERHLSRTLDAHIYRLRKKLELIDENGWRLSSVYGYGYKLQTIEIS